MLDVVIMVTLELVLLGILPTADFSTHPIEKFPSILRLGCELLGFKVILIGTGGKQISAPV